MTVTISGHTFDPVRYDVDADVLYLDIGAPARAVEFEESPEGHALRLDGERRLVGVTIVNVRWLLDHDGALAISLPERVEVGRDALGDALALV